MCSFEALTNDVFDAVPTIRQCADGWALVDYETCGELCPPGSTTAVFRSGDTGLWQEYVSAPLTLCRTMLEADGAPAWLLDTVPWPECTDRQVPIDYRPEPASGPLRTGDVGPRVRALQQMLLEGEWISTEGFAVDGS